MLLYTATVLARRLISPRESLVAARHWFGVSPATVRKLRRALGVEGTRRWRNATASTAKFHRQVRAKAIAKAPHLVRRAKIPATKRGKKRPRHVIEVLRKANLGRPLTAEHRRKADRLYLPDEKQRPAMARAAVNLWRQVIADGQDRAATAEGTNRIPEWQKLAAATESEEESP